MAAILERQIALDDVAALQRFLHPNAVAVVGASRDPDTIGAAVLRGLLAAGFRGAVYPINPHAASVASIHAYPSILDVPEHVDLAVIVVPAPSVISAARECARKGVRALVVISAGFAESGPEGVSRQRELLDVCRSSGMRLIGPNCMGIMNTDPSVRLNASFASAVPREGRIGFLSQSGALGLAVIDHANARGLGMSSFISIGNKADISGNDVLRYWEGDPRTDVILLYLESFGNARRFARITRRITRVKPVVAVKSGRTVAGSRATSSHTGALVSASDETVNALFGHAGVIRTDTLAELFDVAALLSAQPLPMGRRVAILSNAGGPAILCADACEARGLVVPSLADATRDRLRAFLPAEAAVANPVDMIASATGGHYAQAIRALGSDEDVDALIVLFTPPLVTRTADVAAAVRAAVGAMERRIPVLTVFLTSDGADGPTDVRIPTYAYPEDAARALAHVVRYAEARARPEGSVPAFEDARRAEASAIIGRALDHGGGWLAPDDVASLFAAWGLPLVRSVVCATGADAERAAVAMGRPVALKALATGLVHKTEAGAVMLGLGPAEVAKAAMLMGERVRRAGHELAGYLVQPMVPPGSEMLVGVVHDPLFGPVVACGAGGVAVELMKDVAVRLAPVTDLDARDMLRSLATFPLLDGYRGAPKADVAALEGMLLRVGAMADAHPEIAELDANPVIVSADGAVIVDARVRVSPAR